MKFYGWRFPVYFTEHLQATKYDPSLHRKKSFSIKDFFSKMENFFLRSACNTCLQGNLIRNFQKHFSEDATVSWDHLHAFFISNTFIINTRLKLAKRKKQKLSNTLKLNLWQTCPKIKCFCFNEIIWLIVLKMKMIMKTKSLKYVINRPRQRYRHKYAKHNKQRVSVR